MNYKFPLIHTIDDVLPHVRDREEFIVAERDYGTIVNYAVAMPDTFHMDGPDDRGGAIRRECRGLFFDKDGKIASRRFHKFHNVGELEETQPHRIDFTKKHTILEKMDGSMVSAILHDGHVRWITKMGITGVSMNAECYVAANPRYRDFSLWCIQNDLTAIYEWCSRKNRIVLDYPEDRLVLLAVRHNHTGEYLDIH